jgi:glyoxylate carboligase
MRDQVFFNDPGKNTKDGPKHACSAKWCNVCKSREERQEAERLFEPLPVAPDRFMEKEKEWNRKYPEEKGYFDFSPD